MITDERVQGFESLIKRNKSAIVDNDKAAFEAAKLRKKKSIEMKQRELRIDELIEKNEMLESKVDDIQQTLNLVLAYLRNEK